MTPLTDQGFKLFKNTVFNQICPSLISAVLDSISRERSGELVDSDLLKKVVDVFLYLS